MITLMALSFGIGALWDGITTALGIANIIGADDPLSFGLCAVGGVIIFGFGIGTKTIWYTNEPIFLAMRFMWVAAVVFDFYTAFIGNARYIVLRAGIDRGSSLGDLSGGQWLVLLALTAFITASPIILSYLFDPQKN